MHFKVSGVSLMEVFVDMDSQTIVYIAGLVAFVCIVWILFR